MAGTQQETPPSVPSEILKGPYTHSAPASMSSSPETVMKVQGPNDNNNKETPVLLKILKGPYISP